MGLVKNIEFRVVKSIFYILSRFNILLKSCFINVKKNPILILTKPHTIYVAKMLEEGLKARNINVQVEVDQKRKVFSNSYYIVICPQVFKYLPPKHRLISFQLEQRVSEWFDEEYLNILNNSLFVWDYSLSNKKFLEEKNLSPEIYHIPLSINSNYYSEPMLKEIDILFYGNPNSERRIFLLNEAKKYFNVDVVSNLYGKEMLNKIKKARIVLNLHYYENALLETTRIYECLSLGAHVVSESSDDINEYPELVESTQISFFEVGNSKEMINLLKNKLEAGIISVDSQLTLKSKNRMSSALGVAVSKLYN